MLNFQLHLSFSKAIYNKIILIEFPKNIIGAILLM